MQVMWQCTLVSKWNAPKIYKGVMYSYAFVNIYCSVHELWMFIERWTLEGTISAALHLVLLLWTVSWRDLARPPQCLLGVRVDFERAPPSGESKALNHRQVQRPTSRSCEVSLFIQGGTRWVTLGDTLLQCFCMRHKMQAKTCFIREQ